MRGAVAVLVVLGCTRPPGEPTIEACELDADCETGVCARSHECAAPGELREVHVSWTLVHHAPDAAACSHATSADFTVELRTGVPPNDGEAVDFAPVPCTLGTFTIDRLPTRFWIAGVKSREAGMWLPLDATGAALVDLPF